MTQNTKSIVLIVLIFGSHIDAVKPILILAICMHGVAPHKEVIC